jgi:hypothetical protein
LRSAPPPLGWLADWLADWLAAKILIRSLWYRYSYVDIGPLRRSEFSRQVLGANHLDTKRKSERGGGRKGGRKSCSCLQRMQNWCIGSKSFSIRLSGTLAGCFFCGGVQTQYRSGFSP